MQSARRGIKGDVMVDYCANPKCMKPLHYLREGTVYIFDVPNTDAGAGPASHRLEHYWLCGECSNGHLLERSANKELRLTPRQSLRFVRRSSRVADRALAS